MVNHDDSNDNTIWNAEELNRGFIKLLKISHTYLHQISNTKRNSNDLQGTIRHMCILDKRISL